MVFCHELTQASWCWAVSASLEVNLLLGNKSSPILHIQNEQLFLDSSTIIVTVEIPPSLPTCPMQTVFLSGNTLYLWNFIAAWKPLAYLRSSVKAWGRGYGCQCVQHSHPTEGAEDMSGHHYVKTSADVAQVDLGHPQDGWTGVMWRCLKAVQSYLRRAVLEVSPVGLWQAVRGCIQWPLRGLLCHCEADLSTKVHSCLSGPEWKARLTLLLQWSPQPWTGHGAALNNQGGPRWCESWVLLPEIPGCPEYPMHLASVK